MVERLNDECLPKQIYKTNNKNYVRIVSSDVHCSLPTSLTGNRYFSNSLIFTNVRCYQVCIIWNRESKEVVCSYNKRVYTLKNFLIAIILFNIYHMLK